MRKRGSRGLVVIPGALTWSNREKIADLALAQRLPSAHAFKETVAVGGLFSLAPSFSDMLRRTAAYVDKILKGAKPGDLPVEQPTKFKLLINLTARALGLTIPPLLLQRADPVIE